MALSSIEPSTPATLLIVDDDSSAREGLRSIFETAGHKTITVSDAPAALRLLREQSCDLGKLLALRRAQHDFAGLEKAQQFSAGAERHRGLAQPREA